MNDVLLGLPNAGHVKTRMMTSLAKLVAQDRDRDKRIPPGGIIDMASPYLCLNMNQISDLFLATPAEWLWCVEWDHELTLETFYALLASGKRLIGALYFITYAGGIHPCASTVETHFRPITKFKTNEIVPVAHLGLGCTLIHRSVLEKMKAEPDEQATAPYWWFDEDPGHNAKGDVVRHGHDISFFQRAARAGFQAWLHTGVEAPHLDKGRTLDLKAYLAQGEVNTQEKEP